MIEFLIALLVLVLVLSLLAAQAAGFRHLRNKDKIRELELQLAACRKVVQLVLGPTIGSVAEASPTELAQAMEREKARGGVN